MLYIVVCYVMMCVVILSSIQLYFKNVMSHFTHYNVFGFIKLVHMQYIQHPGPKWLLYRYFSATVKEALLSCKTSHDAIAPDPE